MKALRIIALVTFGLGVALLIAGFALRGGDGAQADRDRGANIQATPTNTPRPSPTATPSPTNAPTATPTPTPFAGAVARLQIPRFNVDSKIEEIGLTGGDAPELETPKDPVNTGWYNIYDRPGWGGNAVFSAHVDYYPNILGPFHKLAQLELNDEIKVVMANGQAYRYRVVSNVRYSVDTIPMGDLITPKNRPPDREWITLITCGGEFVASRPGGPGEYLHRDVVVAERTQ